MAESITIKTKPRMKRRRNKDDKGLLSAKKKRKTQVLKIESSLKDLDYEYLLNAYDLEKDSFIIKTTHLDHLAKLLLSKNRICIHGPKGVGKSFSLVYLMCQDSSKTFVLLSPDINYKETLKYLQALNKEDSIAVSSSSAIREEVLLRLKRLSKTLKRNLVILIDVGVWSGQNKQHIKLVTKVMTICSECRLVISLSSGGGFYSTSYSNFDRKFKSLLTKYTRCRILNFSTDEVKLYLAESQCMANMQEVQDLTNYNPYLVSLFSFQYSPTEHDYAPMALEFMLKHVLSIVNDMKTLGTLARFCVEEVKKLYEWGCKAENNIASPVSMLNDFKCSWGAIENFFIYKKINNDCDFVVQCALPCLRLLLNEIIKELSCNTAIPRVPIVQGFFYEDHFFQLMTEKDLTVRISSEQKKFIVHSVLEPSKVTDMTCGVMYHLTYTYPVVDGVGYFKEAEWSTKNVTLIFIQVSLSKYSKHDSKLNDLIAKKAPEDSQKSILEHYAGLCPKGFCIKSTMYVYVSPHIPKSYEDKYSTPAVTFAYCSEQVPF